MNSPLHHDHRSTFWRRLDDLYTGRRPPWDIGRQQLAYLALADTGEIRSRVLDVGCGTGENVLLCAARGLDATGVNLALPRWPPPGPKWLTARFLLYDARQLARPRRVV